MRHHATCIARCASLCRFRLGWRKTASSASMMSCAALAWPLPHRFVECRAARGAAPRGIPCLVPRGIATVLHAQVRAAVNRNAIELWHYVAQLLWLLANAWSAAFFRACCTTHAARCMLCFAHVHACCTMHVVRRTLYDACCPLHAARVMSRHNVHSTWCMVHRTVYVALSMLHVACCMLHVACCMLHT